MKKSEDANLLFTSQHSPQKSFKILFARTGAWYSEISFWGLWGNLRFAARFLIRAFLCSLATRKKQAKTEIQ